MHNGAVEASSERDAELCQALVSLDATYPEGTRNGASPGLSQLVFGRSASCGWLLYARFALFSSGRLSFLIEEMQVGWFRDQAKLAARRRHFIFVMHDEARLFIG
ncbi:hypothetical protein DEV91_11112 [Phyllobacterium brassicacearum]|nr:hypothetical protein DEV91_11112 [Phyllobacterium brassicacearum]